MQTEKWEAVLDIIKDELKPITFKTWFLPPAATLYSDTNNKIIIITQYPQQKNKLKEYESLISNAATEVYGKKMYLDIYTEDEDLPEMENESPTILEKRYKSNLSPKYKFDNFIMGPSNKHAVIYAKLVAGVQVPNVKNIEEIEKPNPLFIYGGSGLGKTHLLQAIGNYIIENDQSKNVIYKTCEQFVNEYIYSLKPASPNTSQTEQTNNFRKKYRENTDVLLIDDIQFLIDKDSSQNEFFNTFNDLINNQKQIVIVSDKEPEAYKKDLPERFRTRFSAGITVNIAPPEYETRAAILELKSDLPSDVKHYIAENISSNIRVLEGALSKIQAYTRITNDPITKELAEEALKEYINNDEKFQLTQDIIKKAVADHFNTTVEDLNDTGRTKLVADARQIAMYLCRSLLKETYEKIGKSFKRNYSTVIHAVNHVEKMMNEDKLSSESVGLAKDVKEIRNQFEK